jgi:hypothetical protein
VSGRGIPHYMFVKSLQTEIATAGGNLTIGVRVDGDTMDTDNNVFVAYDSTRREWRVSNHGGRLRLYKQNLAAMIELAISGKWDGFPSGIQGRYRQAIETATHGWVVLVIEDSQAASCELQA